MSSRANLYAAHSSARRPASPSASPRVPLLLVGCAILWFLFGSKMITAQHVSAASTTVLEAATQSPLKPHPVLVRITETSGKVREWKTTHIRRPNTFTIYWTVRDEKTHRYIPVSDSVEVQSFPSADETAAAN